MEKGYKLEVTYRDHRGARRTMWDAFSTLEEAQEESRRMVDLLEGEDAYNVVVRIIKPIQDQIRNEVAQGATHYKIVAMDEFGGYVSAYLPIGEDIDAALDRLENGLKLIDVYRVTMPFKGQYPVQSNTRLIMRTA